jgi:hypothetical protein
MTNISRLRILPVMACVSLATLLTACGVPSDGYYDANGNYIATDTPHNMSKRAHAPLPGGTYAPTPYDNRAHYDDDRYDRAGYYDRNGYYIARDGGLNVPESMFPPRGMCRVWFVERAVAAQPPVESCAGIRTRVPAGAYVIFGG